MILEACVESIEEAIAAQRAGANRIELCSHLELDGLTPDVDLIKKVVMSIDLPVKVMLRPRAGDFNYSDTEKEDILNTVSELAELPIDGIVFGAMKDNWLDIEFIEEVATHAAPIPITVHKAIDGASGPLYAVAKLKEIEGVTSILTSGGKDTALEGSKILKQMIDVANDEIEIIVAGQVTSQNLLQVHSSIRAKEYHGRKIVSI